MRLLPEIDLGFISPRGGLPIGALRSTGAHRNHRRLEGESGKGEKSQGRHVAVVGCWRWRAERLLLVALRWVQQVAVAVGAAR